MRPSLDQWLAKPTTTCFLRRLLTATGPAHSPQRPALLNKHLRPRLRTSSTLHLSTNDQLAAETSESSTSRVRPGQATHSAGKAASRKEQDASYAFGKVRLVSSDSPAEESPRADQALQDESNAISWIRVLQREHQQQGHDAVAKVWRTMAAHRVQLPTSGLHATIAWTILLSPGSIEDEPQWNGLLVKIINYAKALRKNTGQTYPAIYQCVLTPFFRSPSTPSARVIVKWHKRLRRAGFQPPGSAVLTILDAALQSPLGNEALCALKTIYESSGQRDLYDQCILVALTNGDEAKALFLHQMCLAAGDAPSTEFFSSSGVQRLFDLDGDRSLPMVQSRRNSPSRTDKNAPSQPQVAWPKINREAMNVIMGDVHGIRPKEVSDHFCARLLATRMFSVDFILKGLYTLGVQTLRPLAVRELAVRVESSDEFRKKLDTLKSLGIRIGHEVYCQMVLKASVEQSIGLWQVLLTPDQDVEAYNNPSLQESALATALEKQEWSRAHTALVALSFHGPEAAFSAWNQFLKHHAQLQHGLPVTRIVADMQKLRIPMHSDVIHHIMRHVLRQRNPGRRQVKGHRQAHIHDDVLFVTRTLMESSEAGTPVHPEVWLELLKRFGMENRWDEVERFVHWLCNHYRLTDPEEQRRAPKGFRHYKRTLYHVLNTTTQQALLTWGFNWAVERRRLSMDPYALPAEKLLADTFGPLSSQGKQKQPGELVDYKPLRPLPTAEAMNHPIRTASPISIAKPTGHSSDYEPRSKTIAAEPPGDLTKTSSSSSAAELVQGLTGAHRDSIISQPTAHLSEYLTRIEPPKPRTLEPVQDLEPRTRPPTATLLEDFGEPTRTSPKPTEDWARGLELLLRLRSRGVPVEIAAVRRAFRQRMWVLFGPAFSVLGRNNRARRLNRLSLVHYIRHANEVWPSLVDWIHPALLQPGANMKLLALKFFGVYRSVDLKRRTFVDVRRWLGQMSERQFTTEKRLIPMKQREWQKSGLAIVGEKRSRRRSNYVDSRRRSMTRPLTSQST